MDVGTVVFAGTVIVGTLLAATAKARMGRGAVASLLSLAILACFASLGVFFCTGVPEGP